MWLVQPLQLATPECSTQRTPSLASIHPHASDTTHPADLRVPCRPAAPCPQHQQWHNSLQHGIWSNSSGSPGQPGGPHAWCSVGATDCRCPQHACALVGDVRHTVCSVTLWQFLPSLGDRQQQQQQWQRRKGQAELCLPAQARALVAAAAAAASLRCRVHVWPRRSRAPTSRHALLSCGSRARCLGLAVSPVAVSHMVLQPCQSRVERSVCCCWCQCLVWCHCRYYDVTALKRDFGEITDYQVCVCKP